MFIHAVVFISFSSEGYTVSEDKQIISCLVYKPFFARMAHPVSLRVQPLTIAEALAMGLEIPLVDGVNITVNNTEERIRVPIGAKGKGRVHSSLLCDKLYDIHSIKIFCQCSRG